ncbi:MAG: glycosyltransferase family 2 protein [Mucilaginibacter sp.]
MKVSFCIPSLNRPDHLIQAINSICVNEKYSTDFEICVFNNCSDISYEIVEATISSLSVNYNITYKVSSSRLNIDLSMFEVIKCAKGEYYFFLGDDDYLTETGLQDIFDLIDVENFDMAIFNATIVNNEKNTRFESIGFSNKKFFDLETILVDLKKYCAYGNILIKEKYIDFNDFLYLVGTSHAYGCFWVSFFREYENGMNPIVIVPEKSVVNLTAVEKNYKLLEITFKHADLEHQLYYNIIGPKSTKILKKFESDLWDRQTSLTQLIRFQISGNNINDIKLYNISLYKKLWFKIKYARVLAYVLGYFKPAIKFVLNKVRSKKR